jgi:DNA-binding beta-propeller fold protein YncE
VTTVTTGFINVIGALYDGANVWVTDFTAGTLLKLDSAGAILQTVTLGGGPNYPVFDGTNIWVPRASVPSVAVVRASSGAILATLTGNGSANTAEVAFDGERVLATNNSTGTVSLWKAADLSPLGFFSVGGATSPFGACSDGRDFWIVLSFVGQIGRF